VSVSGSRIIFRCDHPKCPATLEIIMTQEEALDPETSSTEKAFRVLLKTNIEAISSGWQPMGLNRHLCEIHKPGEDGKATPTPKKSPSKVSR